jgi:hypothetical protein
MTKRYTLSMETDDGSMEAPYWSTSRKADALRAAKLAAKNSACPDVVRIWVDDTRTDIGIASFKVPK